MYANKLLLTNNQPTFNTAWPLDRLIAIRVHALMHGQVTHTRSCRLHLYMHLIISTSYIHSFILARLPPIDAILAS